MTAFTGTYTTYATVGTREDLSNIISNLSPSETPFITNAGSRPQAKQVFFEWQLDTLASADNTNAQPEGDDITTAAVPAATSRVGNYCQISRKVIVVSDTDETTDKAGRKSELAYQTAKKAKELKLDIESVCLTRNTAVSSADPRKTSSLLAFVRTNTDVGATGANPAAPGTTYAGIRTDGTQRAFTVTLLNNVIQLGFTNGAKIGGMTLMLGPAQKSVFSSFTNKAAPQIQINSDQTAILGAADVYISDFGNISVIPNRNQRNRDAWLLDFDLIGLKDLRPYKIVDLAKTGDATKKMLLREWGLQVDNEKGLGLVADLI
jgi:hypothetical protein